MATAFQDSIGVSKHDCGVYAIINRSTGRIYIGSSENLANRKRGHRFDLLQGNHKSRRMQSDFTECPQALEFSVIELLPKRNKPARLEREQFWMDFYRSYDGLGYNTHIKSDSGAGFTKSDEARKILSDAHKGKPQPWLRKPIIQMDMAGKEMVKFDSVSAASLFFGFSRPNGNIVSAASGNQKTAYGYKWKYA